MATVIKADGVGKIKKHLATLGLKDHMAEAHRVVRDARLRALQIVEDAREKIERRGEAAEREGYQRGYEVGRAEGEAAGREEAFGTATAQFLEEQKPLLAALDQMMGSFDDAKGELLDRARHDVLTFAVAVAERIVKRTVEIDRTVAVANAEEAIQCITADTDVVIHTHPNDMEVMRRFAEGEAALLVGRRHVRVVEDASVGVGGCVVASETTRVDATIRGQFRHATALLLAEGSSDFGASEAGEMSEDANG